MVSSSGLELRRHGPELAPNWRRMGVAGMALFRVPNLGATRGRRLGEFRGLSGEFLSERARATASCGLRPAQVAAFNASRSFFRKSP